MIELTGTSLPARKVMAHIHMTGHAGIVQTMRPGNDRLLLRSAGRRRPVATGSGAVRLVEGLCGLVVAMIDQIICGDCLKELKQFPDNHFHAIVTDPPYELTSGKNSKGGFMGKAWDATGVAYNVDLWRECLRVLRPGGYLLSFGGSRTYHRMACAIEDAGFEVRDSLIWCYGSGFPKSLSIDKAFDKDNESEREIKWSGWGTSLKPAHESIVMARKPLDGRVIDNIRRWGCGGIAIDKCRIGTSEDLSRPIGYGGIGCNQLKNIPQGTRNESHQLGRFPANLILSHSPGCVKIGRRKIKGSSKPIDRPEGFQRFNGKDYNNGDIYSTRAYTSTGYSDATGHEEIDDWICEEGCPVRLMGEQSGIRPGDKLGRPPRHNNQSRTSGKEIYGKYQDKDTTGFSDTGTAARFFLNLDPDPFFYCAKASSSERNFGLSDLPDKAAHSCCGEFRGDGCHAPNTNGHTKNFHPTVKPLKLMCYLCRLVTPPGGLILDPFAGSGTTCLAAIQEGFHYIGIEKEPEYVAIAHKRIAAIPAKLDRWAEAGP